MTRYRFTSAVKSSTSQKALDYCCIERVDTNGIDNDNAKKGAQSGKSGCWILVDRTSALAPMEHGITGKPGTAIPEHSYDIPYTRFSHCVKSGGRFSESEEGYVRDTAMWGRTAWCSVNPNRSRWDVLWKSHYQERRAYLSRRVRSLLENDIGTFAKPLAEGRDNVGNGMLSMALYGVE
ncbi:hypothetical protein BS17DRAFT_807215 [Gyrodon lividus]|nr:hypothetical protein BS17DRAFT_807215 [Gyrodon lividus]